MALAESVDQVHRPVGASEPAYRMGSLRFGEGSSGTPRPSHAAAGGASAPATGRRSVRVVTRALSFLAIAVVLTVQAVDVRAEGSRSLYPSTYQAGGWRANLDYSATSTLYLNKVRRRGFLYVYAQSGEYIVLGSRNRTAGATNLNDISVYNPQDFGTPGDEAVPGTASFTCTAGPAAPAPPGPHYFGALPIGAIANRAQELAGPNSADNTVTVPNGFQPCAYRAPVTGIYGVVFTGTIAATTGPNGVIDPPVLSTNTVSAWDVTIRADATSIVDLSGRLFTYAFVGFTGGNPRPVYSTHYYVTTDGYRYRQDVRGLDPNGYALYGTPLGFLDNLQPLYKDIRGADALVITNVPAGVTTQRAQYPMFFTDVSASSPWVAEVETVLTALGIPLTPPSPTVTNVSFTGHVGGSTTTVGAGGTFHFTSTDTITYLIVVSRDGADYSAETTANAVLTGIAATGTHAITWDGRDQTGALFPSSATPYPFRVWGRNGEVHFPIIDAENNPGGGPTITRLNGSSPGDTTVFFDDRGYRTSSGSLVGVLNGTLCPTGTPAACSPPLSLDGVDSTSVYRLWASGNNSNSDCNAAAGWGDAKGINLWTYFSTPQETNSLLVDPITVDVSTTVTAPTSATAGSIVQGAFSFANNGNSTALGVGYGMTLTPGLGTVTFGSLPPGVIASYDTASGAVTFTGLPATLAPGETLSGMTFSYTAPATGPVIATTVVSSSSPEETYLTNNTATVSTGIGTVDVSTTVSVPATATSGSTVSGAFTFANYGANAATGVTYAATIGGPGNYPASVTFTSLPPGVAAVYDPATGLVAFTGLPTTLASGRSFFFGFEYPAPGPGTVPVDTTITTGSTDAVPANNTANGVTTIASIADLSVVKTDGSPTYTAGAAISYTVTVSSAGPSTVTSLTLTDALPAAILSPIFTPSIGSYDPGSGAWTGISLAAGGSLTLTVSGTVSGSAAGDLVNTATVAPPAGTTDPDPTDDTATDTDAPNPLADLAVVKTDGSPTYTAGAAISYTITVSNAGPSTATSLTLTDALPAAILSPVYTPSAGSYDPVSGAWTGISLAAGGSLTLTVSGTVSSTATGDLVNTATVAPPAGTTDPDPTDDTATDTDTPNPIADLAVVKTAAPAVDAGRTSPTPSPSPTTVRVRRPTPRWPTRRRLAPRSSR